MEKNLELLQTLAARICHDLAGSIGTINNCLDLMYVADEDVSKKARSLVDEESSNLVRKIKFFRSLYGTFDGEKEMSSIYLSKLLNEFFKDSGMQLKLHFEDGILFLDALLAKAAMCLSTVAMEYARTGEMDLFVSNNYSIKIVTSGEGLKLKKDSFWENDMDLIKTPLSVGNVRQHYVNELCNIINYNITVSKRESAIKFKLTKI